MTPVPEKKGFTAVCTTLPAPKREQLNNSSRCLEKFTEFGVLFLKIANIFVVV